MTQFFTGSFRRRRGVFSWVAALGAALVMTACGGGGSSAGTPAAVSTAISGVVKDSSANPVQGALVQAAGQTYTTLADGRFSFTVPATTPTTVVFVKKSGFASNAKSAPVISGGTIDIAIKLVADQVSTTFNAVSGTTLTSNGATVQIPANAIQTAAGLSYSGVVNVGAGYSGPDTLAGVQAFPAPYEGSDAGVNSPLITMGVIEVKLTDASGNPLQLKTGSLATLTYPASSVSAGASSIPLWSYDESNKIWVRDGQASKQANGTYQGTVSHFSLWNADFKGVTATIKGCFRDSAGNPATNVGVASLRGTGWSYMFNGSSTDGEFTVLRVPSGMPLELYSPLQSAAFGAVAIPSLAAGEVRTLACVTVTNPPTGTVMSVPLPATVFGTTSASYAGGYAGTYSGVEVGTFAVTVAVNGQVTGSATSTTYPGLVSSVIGSVGGTGAVSLTATGSAGSATFSGAISGTGGITGTWQYTGTTSGGTFTGQRN